MLYFDIKAFGPTKIFLNEKLGNCNYRVPVFTCVKEKKSRKTVLEIIDLIETLKLFTDDQVAVSKIINKNTFIRENKFSCCDLKSAFERRS